MTDINWDNVYRFAFWAKSIKAKTFRKWVLMSARLKSDMDKKAMEGLSERYIEQLSIIAKEKANCEGEKAFISINEKHLRNMLFDSQFYPPTKTKKRKKMKKRIKRLREWSRYLND